MQNSTSSSGGPSPGGSYISGAGGAGKGARTVQQLAYDGSVAGWGHRQDGQRESTGGGGPPGCRASKTIRTQNAVCAWKAALPTLPTYPGGTSFAPPWRGQGDRMTHIMPPCGRNHLEQS